MYQLKVDVDKLNAVKVVNHFHGVKLIYINLKLIHYNIITAWLSHLHPRNSYLDGKVLVERNALLVFPVSTGLGNSFCIRPKERTRKQD